MQVLKAELGSNPPFFQKAAEVSVRTLSEDSKIPEVRGLQNLD